MMNKLFLLSLLPLVSCIHTTQQLAEVTDRVTNKINNAFVCPVFTDVALDGEKGRYVLIVLDNKLDTDILGLTFSGRDFDMIFIRKNMPKFVVERVLVHELGHVLGLTHSTRKNDIMQIEIRQNITLEEAVRDLDELYPNQGKCVRKFRYNVTNKE